MTLQELTSADPGLLLRRYDSRSGMWLKFSTSDRRYDLWSSYVEGAQRVYRMFGAENALIIPPVTPTSAQPVFAVVTDAQNVVRGGVYVNGPLIEVNDAHVIKEFAAAPDSVASIARRLLQAIPEGVIELKGAWVDKSERREAALPDLLVRAIVYAARILGVRHVIGSAAEHAVPGWRSVGAQVYAGVPPVHYPDDRYRTVYLQWDDRTWFAGASAEHKRWFATDATTIEGKRDE